MRKIQISGLAFAAIFAFSMISASGASAFLWDQCTKTAPVLAFNNNDCVNGAGTEWGWEEITKLETTKSLLTTLTLSSNGITIDCNGFADGSVGANGEDEITEILEDKADGTEGPPITSTNPVLCEILAGGLFCGTGTADAYPVNLPWKTELVAAGDLLGPHAGGGNPGWHVKCPSGLTNECTKADTILKVENLETELEVDLTFPPEKVPCTTGEGEVLGTTSIFLVNGNALRAM
jgi:hypothetical protein